MIIEKKPNNVVISIEKDLSDESLNDIMRYIKIKLMGSKSTLTDEQVEQEATFLSKKIDQKWLTKNREKYNLW